MTQAVDESDDYLFKRDYRSSIRLNLLHWVMKGLTSYLVHPKVPIRPDAVVADIGTGTAIWLQELAQQLPLPAKLHGFDISAQQFSHPEWLMPNVRLSIHDCYQPFQQEHLGKYDIVHLRFFTCLLNDSNADTFFRNIVTLLKPGGYFQFVDHFPLEAVVRGPSDSSTDASVFPASAQLAAMMRKPSPDFEFGWTTQLHQIFERHGLQVEVFDKFWCTKEYRLPWMQSKLLGLEDVVVNDDSRKPQQFKDLINGLSAEMGHGVTVEAPLFCIVGKKR